MESYQYKCHAKYVIYYATQGTFQLITPAGNIHIQFKIQRVNNLCM